MIHSIRVFNTEHVEQLTQTFLRNLLLKITAFAGLRFCTRGASTSSTLVYFLSQDFCSGKLSSNQRRTFYNRATLHQVHLCIIKGLHVPCKRFWKSWWNSSLFQKCKSSSVIFTGVFQVILKKVLVRSWKRFIRINSIFILTFRWAGMILSIGHFATLSAKSNVSFRDKQIRILIIKQKLRNHTYYGVSI